MADEDVVTILQKLNSDIYESISENAIKVTDDKSLAEDIAQSLGFVMKCDGYSTLIDYAGVNVWNSSDDEREYDEVIDEFEPLEVYLKRQAMIVNKMIPFIKFKEDSNVPEQ